MEWTDEIFPAGLGKIIIFFFPLLLNFLKVLTDDQASFTFLTWLFFVAQGERNHWQHQRVRIQRKTISFSNAYHKRVYVFFTIWLYRQCQYVPLQVSKETRGSSQKPFRVSLSSSFYTRFHTTHHFFFKKKKKIIINFDHF